MKPIIAGVAMVQESFPAGAAPFLGGKEQMGMTMTQKILAAAAGLDSVEAGQLIEARLDLVLGNDITSPVAIHEMSKFKKRRSLTKTRLLLLWIILFRIKISNRRSTANVCGSLHADTILQIILMWDRWD